MALLTHLCVGLCIFRDPCQTGVISESWSVVVHILDLNGGSSSSCHPSTISGLHDQEVGFNLLSVQDTHCYSDGPCGGVDGENFREGGHSSHIDVGSIQTTHNPV